tara:strand:- start:3755 stop:4063 length:309 start_codon:yes stop_codon:yes gene_type:complete
MERITTQDLERELAVLNGYFGIQDYDRVGRFELENAYGGYKLIRIMTVGGGERDISKRGTKREIYEHLYAINKVIYEFKEYFETQTGFAVDDMVVGNWRRKA